MLHADDTTVPVLDPGRGRTRTGRLWAVVRDERRSAEQRRRRRSTATRPTGGPSMRRRCSAAVAASCTPTAMPASTACLRIPIRRPGSRALIEVACWAHARRKHLRGACRSTASPLAKEALERIAELFAIETRINGAAPTGAPRGPSAGGRPAARRKLEELPGQRAAPDQRQEHARARRSAMRSSRWIALTRYTTDGRLEMTNNAVERAIRPLAMAESFYTSSSSICKH